MSNLFFLSSYFSLSSPDLAAGVPIGEFGGLASFFLINGVYIGTSSLGVSGAFVAFGDVFGSDSPLNAIGLTSYVGSFKTLTSDYFSLLILLASNSL